MKRFRKHIAVVDRQKIAQRHTLRYIAIQCLDSRCLYVSVNFLHEDVSKSCTLPLRCRSGQMLATPPKWIPSHFILRRGPWGLPPYITLHLVITVVALLLFPTWESNDIKRIQAEEWMKGPKQTPMFWHRVSRQWGKFADRDKRMSYHTAVCACVGVCVWFVCVCGWWDAVCEVDGRFRRYGVWCAHTYNIINLCNII